jgi:ABC-type nitrate/sulfonate/bicarbonate transport system substrate-binding protein
MMDFDPIPAFIVFRRDFAEKHEDEVVNALRGYYKAVEWIRAHPAESVDVIADGLAKQGVRLDRAVVDMAWKTVDLDTSINDEQVKAYLKGAADLLLKDKKLKQEPDWNRLLRFDLAHKALGK